MPSEFTVFLVADALLAKGERPSLRKMREALPTGGSPREVCKHLRAWRKKRGYDPKLEPTDMSKAMKAAGQALAMDLWKQAKREATQAFSREREAAAAMATDDKQDREHLLGMIETLQAENAALATRAQAAEDEAARVLARLQKVEYQLERFRAEEFWDRVMQEIFEIIPVGGAMSPAEILPELRAVTVRGATLHKEPLTPGILKKKMDVRSPTGATSNRQGMAATPAGPADTGGGVGHTSTGPPPSSFRGEGLRPSTRSMPRPTPCSSPCDQSHQSGSNAGTGTSAA